MVPDRTRYVVSFDIVDDKRRRRAVRCLESYGDRVQYSMFEAVLPPGLFDSMLLALQGLLDPTTDRLAVDVLCGTCARRRIRWGQGLAVMAPGEEAVFIV